MAVPSEAANGPAPDGMPVSKGSTTGPLRERQIPAGGGATIPVGGGARIPAGSRSADTPAIIDAGSRVGTHGNLVVGADGKPILLGADGKPILGADGRPNVGADGSPILGADGKPILSRNGKPIADASRLPPGADQRVPLGGDVDVVRGEDADVPAGGGAGHIPPGGGACAVYPSGFELLTNKVRDWKHKYEVWFQLSEWMFMLSIICMMGSIISTLRKSQKEQR